MPSKHFCDGITASRSKNSKPLRRTLVVKIWCCIQAIERTTRSTIVTRPVEVSDEFPRIIQVLASLQHAERAEHPLERATRDPHGFHLSDGSNGCGTLGVLKQSKLAEVFPATVSSDLLHVVKRSDCCNTLARLEYEEFLPFLSLIDDELARIVNPHTHGVRKFCDLLITQELQQLGTLQALFVPLALAELSLDHEIMVYLAFQPAQHAGISRVNGKQPRCIGNDR
mmetsp:Transcript_2693/g.4698  ORF Transcript_2693/g.4698 Transcript_2693/m.4698 type:complete len:226 (+) Transcript_2693:709-1386(+)